MVDIPHLRGAEGDAQIARRITKEGIAVRVLLCSHYVRSLQNSETIDFT